MRSFDAGWCAWLVLFSCPAFHCLPAQFLRSRDATNLRFFEYPDIDSPGDMPHFLLVIDDEATYYNDACSALREVASELASERLAFVVLKTSFTSALKFFKFQLGKDVPMALTIKWSHGYGKRPFQMFLHSKGSVSDLGRDLLLQAARKFLSGELQPWIRSAPILEEAGSHRPKNGAMEIVASQFQALALSQDRDVLVMFYAPWCGFSKRMQPRVDALARNLSHAKSLAIFKIDDTRNDVDHPVMTQLTGYPFLAIFPAHKKDQARQVKVNGKLLGDPDAWLLEAVRVLRQHVTYPIPDAPNASNEGSEVGSSLLSDEEERQDDL